MNRGPISRRGRHFDGELVEGAVVDVLAVDVGVLEASTVITSRKFLVFEWVRAASIGDDIFWGFDNINESLPILLELSLGHGESPQANESSFFVGGEAVNG